MKSDISYFNINWLSEHDGPGIRLVLFLQGCLLDCKWCHSPHSQPSESPLLYFDSLCKKCKRCKEACSQDVHIFKGNNHILQREKCIFCGKCVDNCLQSSSAKKNGALVLPTRKEDVKSLYQKIMNHLKMINHEGGITFSGGEPLLQADSLLKLAGLCKMDGIHTALETSGIGQVSSVSKLIPYIDTWLVGLRLGTGYGKLVNHHFERKIRETLVCLTKNGITDIIARIPVIPGFTTSDEYLTRTIRIINDYGISKIDILPHNPESSLYYKASGMTPLIQYDDFEADLAFKYVSSVLLTNKLTK